MSSGHLYLDSYLAPLAQWLGRDDVTDIYVNRPGEVWTETLGGAIERHETPGLDRTALLRLARQIAAANAQGINRESPLLAASLPDGSRVQVVLPPATRGEVAIAIRRHVVQDLDLESYRGAAAGLRIEPLGTSGRSGGGHRDDPIAFLRQAVRDRRNILVSGGTSTGKTTFLNTLLREVPQRERLILIEDAAELQLRHENAVGLIAARGNQGEAEVNADDLLIAALRMRPDRIILGELRGPEAYAFLRAINTGHPGSLSTIHADSPERAIDQLALLVLQAGSRLSWDDVVRYIARSIDVIVQLDRSEGVRRIAQLRITQPE
ncbi:MAG: P-type DNA transfer ATPase VirB11 [Novosphingobium sp.]